MAEICLGVLADTHIPDRSAGLHPRILPVFRQAGVQAILHAGDVSVPQVLAELSALAPVHTVGGNRDWLRLPGLPAQLRLSFEGIEIALVHGHGGLVGYFKEKITHTLHGYRREYYIDLLARAYPGADVIVFGHSHQPLNLRVGQVLLFNPGSACCPENPNDPPSAGLLYLSAGSVRGEIISLAD